MGIVMENIILSVSHLTKEFNLPPKNYWERIVAAKEKFTAVDNVSFQVHEGEILGLLGPNGAGKTTTIHMILGLLKPTKGKIDVFGLELFSNRQNVLGQMNFSSAYNELPYQLTVWENLYIFGELYHVPDLKERINTLITVLIWKMCGTRLLQPCLPVKKPNLIWQKDLSISQD